MTDGPEALNVAAVAASLHQQSLASAAVATLATQGVEVLVLKGVPFQQRFFGTPAAYPSVDVDLLVRPRDARNACDALMQAGWLCPAVDNAVFWRWSAVRNFVLNGVTIDLHWSVHSAHLPARCLSPIGAALWTGATRRSDGLFEPRPEPLFVYLVAHGSGHRWSRPDWERGVQLVAAHVRDWDEVSALAAACRLSGVVAEARADRFDRRRRVILDGAAGQSVWWLTAIARGRFMSRPFRMTLRRFVRYILTRGADD